jgi:hypothetical protein
MGRYSVSVDEGGWRWQEDILRKQFPEIIFTSAFRNNSTANGGGLDYHSRGRAVDMPPKVEYFNWIAANYPQSEELIFSPMGARQLKNGKSHVYSAPTKADHYNHIHWAIVSQVAPSGANAVNVGIVNDPIGTVSALGNAISFFTTPGIWARVGVALAGILLVIVGLARIAGQKLPTVRGVIKSVRRPVNG